MEGGSPGCVEPQMVLDVHRGGKDADETAGGGQHDEGEESRHVGDGRS